MTHALALDADHLDVMAALSCYEVMTLDQLHRVGATDGDKRRLAQAVRLLVRKNLVGRTDPRLIAYIDRMPSVHWITPKGAALLTAEGWKGVTGSERTSKGWPEFKHRMAIVNFHIALREWAHATKATVRRFVADFSPGAGVGRKATTLDSVTLRYSPDALARLTLADNSRAILALEVERGGDTSDRFKFREGLSHYREVAETRHVEGALDDPGAARFVLLFNTGDMRRKVLEAWPDQRAPVWRQFYCKSLDELGGAFNADWHRPGGAPRPMFAGGTPTSPA